MTLREELERIWNDPVVRCPKHVVWWNDADAEYSESGRVIRFAAEGGGLFYAEGKRVDLENPKHGVGRRAWSYYDRSNIVHLDGTPIFQTAGDRASEQEISAELEQCWGCAVRPFGALSPVDWYAERAGRLVGVLELKSRTHTRTTHPTVFLNVRKWLALSLASIGLGCPALFVVRFTDDLCWARLSEIDASEHRIAGCLRIVKSSNDIEPVIEVPVQRLRTLRRR